MIAPTGESDAFVFFGATGDLAYRQIYPALQALVRRGLGGIPIIGVAKSALCARYNLTGMPPVLAIAVRPSARSGETLARSIEAVMSGAVAELRKSIESNASEALIRLLPRPASHGPRAEAIVAVGKASAAIVKVASARSVDLIVMGVSGRGALDVALLGSTTHHVIREGTWPVLTVRTFSR